MSADAILDTLEQRAPSVQTTYGPKTSQTYSLAPSDRFYRPPRLSRSSMSPVSPRLPSKQSQESVSVHTSSSGSVPSTISESVEGSDTRCLSLASDSTIQPRPQASAEPTESRPLGPRWDDYSFRESDLFFQAPPTHLRVTVPDRPRNSLSTTSSQSSTRWARLTGTQSSRKSFQVVRPSLDPQNFPPSSSSEGRHSRGNE